MDKEIVIARLKRNTEKFHPGKQYKIIEYPSCYSVVIDSFEPFLYEKQDGFPLRKNFAQLSTKETSTSKIIFESGGKKNGKK